MDNQKKNIGLYVLIVVLFVLVLVLGGYIIYDKIQDKKPVEDSKVDKINTNTNTSTFISKIDNNKDWIYDAEYTKNVSVDSYSTVFNNTYYAKDIVVPYINVKSTYADNSNNEIKNVFEDAVKTYNTGVNDEMTYVDECGYKKYFNNDILSVVLTYGVGATDVVHPKYYTYNINLETGNQLTYEEAYLIAGYNSSNINEKVENAITKVMNDKFLDLPDQNYPYGTNFNTYNNQSISNYKTSVSNNTLKYFLSESGELNVVVTLSIPVGIGAFDTIITVN